MDNWDIFNQNKIPLDKGKKLYYIISVNLKGSSNS